MLRKGLVIKSNGNLYVVRDENDSVFACRIKGKMRLDDIKSTNPIAVGDYVMFEAQDNDESVIEEVLERRNYVVRKASNLSKQTHILAANVDQALLLVTINYPITTAVFIDRFLASAEAYNVPVVLIFNKIDRYDKKHLEDLENTRAIYENLGYRTLTISARHEDGLEAVREVLKDKVSVIAGHSGAGKSTLINKIEPGLNLKTDEISEINNSGKHTTTHAEMHSFSFGGYIIDTPGIRGFGITNIEKTEISHFFRDIFAISPRCQFSNCTHMHEPGCAVKQAIADGTLPLSRYNSYVNIMNSSEDKYRN